MTQSNRKGPGKHSSDDFRIRVGRYIVEQEKREGRPRRNRIRSSISHKNGRAKSYRYQRFQQVVVQAHPFKNGGGESLKKHFRYIARQGTGHEKGSPEIRLNGNAIEHDEGMQIVSDWAADRHHFRFIISPENSQKIDLKEFTRRYVSTLELELGTELSWISTEHYNTAQPHVHLIIRGKRSDGKDLVISSDRFFKNQRLIKIGQQVATDLIGYRSEREILRGEAKEIVAERYTSLDWKLAKKMRELKSDTVDLRKNFERNGLELSDIRDRLKRRLRKLQSLGLAKQISKTKWQISESFVFDLKQLGRRNDILSKVFSERALRAGNVHSLSLDSDSPERIFGLVRRTGVEDELRHKRFVVIEALDGKMYHLSLPEKGGKQAPEVSRGSLVEVKPGAKKLTIKPIDNRIEQYARSRGGIFDLQQYFHYAQKTISLPDGVKIDDFLGNFVKRLQVLQAKKIVTRSGPTSWVVPDKFISLINEFTPEGSKRIEYAMDVLSQGKAGNLVRYPGLTGLDLILVQDWPDSLSLDTNATQKESGLMNLVSERLRYLSDRFNTDFVSAASIPRSTVEHLQDEGLKIYARDVLKLSDRIVSVDVRAGFKGTFVGMYDLPAGRYGVVKGEHEISFVPAIRGMERLKKGELVKVEVSQGRKAETMLERTTGLTFSFSKISRVKSLEKGIDSGIGR